MLPQEIVRRKRDGGTLTGEEIAFFVRGLTDGSIADGAVAAFAMAVFYKGLTTAECVAFTLAMTRSGDVLDWSDLPGPALDKHSTGGVGDTVSLMLAPAVAACGGFVPMISGRGLGHTGGTLDKLESIPGYRTKPDSALFRRVVREAGAAIIGQTAALAPADGRLYAIRDVTATVESIPLITASILSKKLAAGLSALVMDVKAGGGAFMTKLDDARELARSLATVASAAGLPTRAVLTDMDQPLSHAAGNALEARSAIDYLTGARREPRMHAVTVALGGEMLAAGGLAADADEGERRIDHAIVSGAAAERFARMVGALGGPTDLVERPGAHLPAAPVIWPVRAEGAGFVTAVDTRAVGLVVVALGGGRTRADQTIDPAVGLTELAALGDRVENGRLLGVVHARSNAGAERAALALRAAFRLGSEPPPPRPVLLERFGSEA